MASSKHTDKNIGNWGRKNHQYRGNTYFVFDKRLNRLPISFHQRNPTSSFLLMINDADFSFWAENMPDNAHQLSELLYILSTLLSVEVQGKKHLTACKMVGDFPFESKHQNQFSEGGWRCSYLYLRLVLQQKRLF